MKKLFGLTVFLFFAGLFCFAGETKINWSDGETNLASFYDADNEVENPVITEEEENTIIESLPFEIEDRGEVVSLTDDSLEDVISAVENSGAPAFKPREYDPLEKAYVKVVEIKQLPGVFLYLFSNRDVQNIALLRASAYSEMDLGVLTHGQRFGKNPILQYKKKEGETRSVIVDRKEELLNIEVLAKGHDIPGNKMIEFLKRYSELSSDDIAKDPYAQQLLAIEKAVMHSIKQKAKKYGYNNEGNNNFVIVSFSLTDEEALKSIGPHEFLHAQFFTQPKFKEAVIKCLEALENDPEKKHLIVDAVKFLKEGAYPNIDKDKELRANEIMAYMISPNNYEYLSNHEREYMRNLSTLVNDLRPYIFDFIGNYKKEEGWKIEPVITKIKRDEETK